MTAFAPATAAVARPATAAFLLPVAYDEKQAENKGKEKYALEIHRIIGLIGLIGLIATLQLG